MFDALAAEFLTRRQTGSRISYAAFVAEKGLECHPSTFFRRVKDYQERKAHDLESCPQSPWDLLPQTLRGAFLAFVKIHHDSNRKKRGQKSLTAVIALFRRDTLQNAGINVKVSDGVLRAIADDLEEARASLNPQGEKAYWEKGGKYLHSPSKRLERVQMDVTELNLDDWVAPELGPKKVFILLSICVATKMILGFEVSFQRFHGSDACRMVYRILRGKNHGPPGHPYCGQIGVLQTDNGIFKAQTLKGFAARSGIRMHYNEPGKPMQNGHIEKAIGDLKRGLLPMAVPNGPRNKGPLEHAAVAELLSQVEAAVEARVEHLNTGVARKKSPVDTWITMQPQENFAATGALDPFIEHSGAMSPDGFIRYNQRCWAKPRKICSRSDANYFVREYLDTGNITLHVLDKGKIVSLGPLTLVSVEDPNFVENAQLDLSKKPKQGLLSFFSDSQCLNCA